MNVRLGTFTECGSRARRLPKGGAGGCYASPREDVRRERLGRSRDRFRTGDAQELAGRRRLAALGCISSPLGRVRHADPGFFDLFPTTYFPPVRQAIPAWPQKSGAALDAFPPPIFRGADTRTHHRIRAGRSDAGIFLPARDRGSESDIATHAPPLSPRPRRASASDRPSRSPPRSCRPTCLAKPDYAPTKVLGSSRLASRCITNY